MRRIFFVFCFNFLWLNLCLAGRDAVTPVQVDVLSQQQIDAVLPKAQIVANPNSTEEQVKEAIKAITKLAAFGNVYAFKMSARFHGYNHKSFLVTFLARPLSERALINVRRYMERHKILPRSLLSLSHHLLKEDRRGLMKANLLRACDLLRTSRIVLKRNYK